MCVLAITIEKKFKNKQSGIVTACLFWKILRNDFKKYDIVRFWKAMNVKISNLESVD